MCYVSNVQGLLEFLHLVRVIKCYFAQTLSQHGCVQSLWPLGHQHRSEGCWGTQGEFLSGGHGLWSWISPAIRLHYSHAGTNKHTFTPHGSMVFFFLFWLNRLYCCIWRVWVQVAMTHTLPTSTASGLTSQTWLLEPTCWRCESLTHRSPRGNSDVLICIYKDKSCWFYFLQITVNPDYLVPESDFSNNVVRCEIIYTGIYIQTRNCILTGWVNMC